MTAIDRVDPELRDDLVAYLDGELPEGRTQQIDDALSTNPVVRHEVETLTRTWEMLEVLPLEKASPGFTEKTLESIVVRERTQPLSETRLARVVREAAILAGWFAACAAVAAIAFFATYRWLPAEEDPLLDDLPVVRNLNSYKRVGSTDFLKSLDNSGAFDE